MKKQLFVFYIFLAAFSSQYFVQAQSAEQERAERERSLQEHIRKSNEALVQAVNQETKQNRPQPILSPVRRIEIEEIIRKNKEYRAKLEVFRAPHPDDLSKYSDFLQQKNTGLIKLFPDLHCDSKFVVKVGGNCANAVQDSYSYSFRRKDYSDGVFHDIRFDEEKLWIDGFLSQAIITDVGDVALENISLQNTYAQFLLDFKPSSENAEAKQQFWKIAGKIENNGFKYGKVVKPILNTTYLARIVNYRLGDSHLLRLRVRELDHKDQKTFLLLSFDNKRSDIILAFRIIRIDSDNSVSILWKQLSEKKSPELKYAKGEKWTDLKIN